jgi:hypothetical protein
MLDRQAELPSALERTGGGARRDYPALAGLVGLTREGYAELAPPSQRAARLQIDRELSERRTQRSLRRPERISGRARGAAEDRDSGQEGRGGGTLRPERRESLVLADARAVAEGRKKELGFGRP